MGRLERSWRNSSPAGSATHRSPCPTTSATVGLVDWYRLSPRPLCSHREPRLRAALLYRGSSGVLHTCSLPDAGDAKDQHLEPRGRQGARLAQKLVRGFQTAPHKLGVRRAGKIQPLWPSIIL